MLFARPVRALVAAALAVGSIATLWLLVPNDARAARGLELGIQDDALFVQGNKRFPGDKSFQYVKALGVTRIRVNLLWAWTMPSPQAGARRRPDRKSVV
jgi:aryl-phospho-beta-D-glucosidase BglC (GH1 family)